jgi:hypothetical protein
MARNRVIYQSEALFVSPNATGAHWTCSAVLSGTGIDNMALHSLGTTIGLQEDPYSTLNTAGTSTLSSASTLGGLDLYNISGKIVEANAAHNPATHGNSWNELYSTSHIFGGGTNQAGGSNKALTSKVLLQADPATTNWEGVSDADLRGITSASTTPSHVDIYNISGAVMNQVTDPSSYGMVGWNLSNPLRGTALYTNHQQWDTWNQSTSKATGYFIDPSSGIYESGAPEEGVAFYSSVSSFKSALSANKATAEGGHDGHLCTGFLLQPFSGTYENLIQQLHRVQSANYSFSVNRTDVNTFGQLARIDAIVLEPPTVSLDFSYYPTDGFNERNLGFHIQGSNAVGEGMSESSINAVSGHLQDDSAGRNFFILTTPEGTDAFGSTRALSERSVISLGNGFLSDYTIDGSVGSIPSVSATVELFNAKSDVGTQSVGVPSVSLKDGTAIAGTDFTIGHPQFQENGITAFRGDSKGAVPSTGSVTATALRPGDITLEIPEKLSIFNKVSGDGEVHIQNFSLSVPLARTPIDRLGTRFAFSRSVDFPVVTTLSVSALVSEVAAGNLASVIDSCEEHDVRIKMKSNVSCGSEGPKDAIIIDFKGARIDSESMTSDIGSNKSVDLTFTAQIGGPEDKSHGVYISGANRTNIPKWHPTPTK